jgi:hypothetical protein
MNLLRKSISAFTLPSIVTKKKMRKQKASYEWNGREYLHRVAIMFNIISSVVTKFTRHAKT